MRAVMRALMHGRPRDERGATAVVMALSLSLMIAALGLSVDVGNASYQQNRLQHAADATALAVAADCARQATTCTVAGATATANGYVSDNADSATVSFPAGVSSTAGSVTVSLGTSVDMPLLGLVGAGDKDLAVSATASWDNGHPTEGYPVLPLGVGYCTWANNHAAAGTPTEGATHLTIRTDVLQSIDSLLSPVTGTLADIIPLDDLVGSLLGTSTSDTCTGSGGQELLTLKGGVWISGLAGAVLNVSCTVRVAIDLTGFVGSLASGVVMPTECTNKFGTQIRVGSTILLPVYVPDSNLQNAGLKLLSVCGKVGTTTVPGVCVEVPPKLGVKIVGFAPFTVTGWNFGATASPDASAPCPSLSLGLPLRTILQAVVTALPLGGLLWSTIVGPLLSLLNNGGNLTLAVGCTGIQGYFTKTFTRDPNFQYASSGLDLGASFIKLTD